MDIKCNSNNLNAISPTSQSILNNNASTSLTINSIVIFENDGGIGVSNI